MQQDFEKLSDLSTNGSVIFATDDFFAPCEMMLQRHEAVWDAEKFSTFGKWMDGTDIILI